MKAEWDSFGNENPMLIHEIEAKYSDAIKRRIAEQIVTFQTNYQRQLENARDGFVNDQLIPVQQQFKYYTVR